VKKIIKAISYFLIIACLSFLVFILVDYFQVNKGLDLNTTKTMDQAITTIKAQGIKEYTPNKINQLLKNVDTTKFKEIEKIKIKREIIREAGFSNFDWKGTFADVTSFQDVKIEVEETKDPLLVYRRGYSNEPSSSFGLGRWWSNKSRTIEEARNELAILENWGNPLTAEYKIKVPSGIRILKGIAASQDFKNPEGQVIETRKGGGVQYFINVVKKEWLEK